MRNSTLATVVGMVKAETGKSLDASATAADAEIYQVVDDVQTWLSSEYDWPFMQKRFDQTVTGRYNTFPTTLNLERAGQLKAYVKWNQTWQDVDYGIAEENEFNYVDSDRGQVLDPIQRWQLYDETQFEVWPLPASAQAFRFFGQRVTGTLKTAGVYDPAKTFDLDDLLVTYFAAAEYLTREQQTDSARMFLTMGQDRLRSIRATYPTRERPAILIGSSSKLDRRALRVVPMVVVGGK